jgi:CBS domain containing-hemolysin-like protein
MTLAFNIILLIILIILSAFFAGVETAFVSLSEIRIEHLIEKRKKNAELIKKLRGDYDNLIITLLIGNNLVNISASSIATVIAMDLLKSNSISFAIGIMTLIILIFGEITPKTIAMAKNEVIALNTAKIIAVLQFIFYPIAKALQFVTKIISKAFIKKRKPKPTITEEEIKSVINLGEQVGEVEEDEKEMIHNIFRFSDIRAYEIMTPKNKMFSLPEDQSIKESLEEINKMGYSRIPIYNKDNKVTGIVHIKDILKKLDKNKENIKLKKIKRDILFITKDIEIDELLRKFQKSKSHIAILLDEYGESAGLITIEDLLEEIVGEIYDESDEKEIIPFLFRTNVQPILQGFTRIRIEGNAAFFITLPMPD